MFFRKKEKPSVGSAIAFITQAIETSYRHKRNAHLHLPSAEEMKELRELEHRLWEAHNTISALNNNLNQRASERQKGFTLIELSVVLVIIGLIVGGIYLGQAIVESAKIRAQISQIDQYKAAVNTFKLKYGALPGDVTPARATAFGFVSRTGGLGNGDNDGHIRWIGWSQGAYAALGGETVLFWTDLSSAKLIPEQFTDSSDVVIVGNANGSPSTDYSLYLPRAKIGNGGFLLAFDNVIGQGIPNYSGLVFEIGTVVVTTHNQIEVQSAITATQAMAIDAKIDDGLPLTGTVVAASLGINFASSIGSVGWIDIAPYTSGGPIPASDYCVLGTTTPSSYNPGLAGGNVVCNLMFAGQ